MKWLIGGGVLAAIAGLLWLRFAFKRLGAGFRASGAPTPEQARIETETKKTAGEIAAEAERKQAEVVGADKKTTLQLGRDLLFRRVRK